MRNLGHEWQADAVRGRGTGPLIDCSPLPDISALVSARTHARTHSRRAAPRAPCQEHSPLQRGRWEGGARRDSKIFPLVLRGLRLYIRLAGAARETHGSDVLQDQRQRAAAWVLSLRNKTSLDESDPQRGTATPREVRKTRGEYGHTLGGLFRGGVVVQQEP